MRSDFASPDGYGAQMSDLDNARRLLVEAEKREELTVYRAIGPDVRILLSAGWVAIANAAVDEKVWGDKDE